MRGLSIRQPWAWAVAAGLKHIENRSWDAKYRGPIAIHAGANKITDDELIEVESNLVADGKLGERDRLDKSSAAFDKGAVIAVVELVDVVELPSDVDPDSIDPESVPASLCDADGELSLWAQGPFCWVFANPRPVTPLPMKGKLSWMDVDEAALHYSLRLGNPVVKNAVSDEEFAEIKRIEGLHKERGKMMEQARQLLDGAEAINDQLANEDDLAGIADEFRLCRDAFNRLVEEWKAWKVRST